MTIEEGLTKGKVAAILIRTGPYSCSWVIANWFAPDLSKGLADELIEAFRDALYAHIRPQGQR